MESVDMRGYYAICQADPLFYVMTRFDMPAGWEGPSEQQKEGLRELANPDCRLSIRSGISTGKTTFDAWAIHWHVDCFPHSKVAVTAPTRTQLQDALVAEVELWNGRKKPGLFPPTICTKETLQVDGVKGQFATFKTASKENPEALQGLHADYVLAIVDEAAGVADAVFEPLRGATGKYATRIVYTANPNRAAGMFHRTQTHSAYRNWKRLVFNSWDSPHSPKEYLQELLDEYGEDSNMYKIRVLGQFPSASPCQLIPTDLVLEAQQRAAYLKPSMYSFAPVILGVDVAWEGDDRSVIYMRQGNYSKLLGVYHDGDDMLLASRVVDFWRKHNVDACFVDVGWGTGVISRLRSLGFDPIPVHFGGTALNADVYRNRRAEMWFTMRQWLVDGGVVEDREDLLTDLTAPEYGPDDTKKTLERKKDIKKRVGFSPDEGDALALTFAEPVIKEDESIAGYRRQTPTYKPRFQRER